ncbi:MAG: ATP-binding cassette domain-containing protein [Planctomycetales bacterium]|nr:ATP-binding cassette domain-containing protein [Planctomycetales bacterium]
MDDRFPPIVVEGLYKAYQRGHTKTPVLRGVDLRVERGECVFLAGPSGSGKTTLLSILGCILSPDRGQVRILQHEVHRLDPPARAAIRREKIGFLFQKLHLINGLTALENVCVPLMLRGKVGRAQRQRARDLLDRFGLHPKLASDPRNLSLGQCQRVALARALVGDPPLILADEPTASLDAENGAAIMQMIRQLTRDEGRTAVVVTHDPRIFPLADRILHLDEGCIAAAPSTAGSPIRPRPVPGLLPADFPAACPDRRLETVPPESPYFT